MEKEPQRAQVKPIEHILIKNYNYGPMKSVELYL